MAEAAYDGCLIQEWTARDIRYSLWNPYLNPYPCGTAESPATCFAGGEEQHTGASTVRGMVRASATSVMINGKPAACAGDPVEEQETVTGLPGGAYNVRNHEGGRGAIDSANTAGVYCEGKLLAVNGSTVSTHNGQRTVIAEGSSNVFVG